MKHRITTVLAQLLVAAWLCSACSAAPTEPAVADTPTPTAAPTASASADAPPPTGEQQADEPLAFAVDAPHIKGVLEKSKLPADVKGTVKRVLSGEKVDDAAMARARKEVPEELGQVLDEVAAGKQVSQAVGGKSGAKLVRSIDPDTAKRWEDFSKRSEQIEKNLVAFLSAFNAHDANALVKTLTLPFYTDDIPRNTAEEVKAVFTKVWKDMGSRGEANVRGKKCAHMPSEAFEHAPKLGPMPIDDRIRSYVKRITASKPGYVSVCEFAIETKDGKMIKDDEAALFISREAKGKYGIVAVRD